MRESGCRIFVVAVATVALGFLLEIGGTPLQAQTTIDATKISCDDLINGRAATPRTIVVWISGYLSAKRDIAIVDPAALRNRTRELERYCYQQKNLKVQVMKAMEELFVQKSQ